MACDCFPKIPIFRPVTTHTIHCTHTYKYLRCKMPKSLIQELTVSTVTLIIFGDKNVTISANCLH